MKRLLLRLSVGTAMAMMVVVPAVANAWACVGLVSLTTSSPTVQPGGTLIVSGKEFAAGASVLIRLDSLSGPVLATAPPPTTTMTSRFTVAVALPADVGDGPHLLIATQDEHNMNGGIPARALIYVGTAPPATVAPRARPASVMVNSGVAVSTLVLIGLAVATAGLFLAWLSTLLLGRTRPASEAVKGP